MAIDFRLTASQRELKLRSRKFAKEVLSPAIEAETLPTPEERFLATKPIYEAMVAAGFLRKCIPVRGGRERWLIVRHPGGGILRSQRERQPDADWNVLGLFPILLGGSAEQRDRLLAPFLKKSGAPLAGFCATEPGGSANAASPPPGEGVRTTAKLDGRQTGSFEGGRAGFRLLPAGIAKAPTFFASFAERTPPDRPKERPR